MNRYIAAAICVFTTVVLLSSCGKIGVRAEEEYCLKIHTLIKEEDFCSATVEEQKIVLYDAYNEKICEIPFTERKEDVPLISIKKVDGLMFFITGGAVDDEYGILILDGDVNHLMDGLQSIERIGGNTYRYSTRK